MATSLTDRLNAKARLDSGRLEIAIEDTRAESLELFRVLNERQLDQVAVDAWSIGLRALRGAYLQAQEVRLQDVGKTLVEDVDESLRAVVELQRKTVADVLGRYFDPTNGEVAVRLREFVSDSGQLARLLRDHLGDNSVLAETLAKQVGAQSPLFKKLSTTESDGLVQVLQAKLTEVLQAEQEEFTRALDPLAEDGAVARFLRTLRSELRAADEDRGKQLACALGALDANDESSLLSRLIRETHQARRTLLEAINPETPGSPLGILKRTLVGMLEDQRKSQAQVVEDQRRRMESLEKDLKESVARLETRRDEQSRSVRGGFDFEDAVARFVSTALQGGMYRIEVTAKTRGFEGRNTGDIVVHFTSDSAYDGASIVIEAKRDASYTTTRALEEMELARKNRRAAAGVFVMAKSHVPVGFPGFAKYGNTVLVVWDETESTQDAYLHAAIIMALGLVARRRTAADEGDLNAMRDVEQRIRTEVARLDKIRGFNEKIRKNSDNLGDELRKGESKLDLLLRKARSTLKALNVELADEDAEKNEPVGMNEDGLSGATAALSASDTTDDATSPPSGTAESSGGDAVDATSLQ